MQPPRSTQPGHPFVGRRNEYQPKSGDALRLERVKVGGLMGIVHCSSYAHWKARSGLPIIVLIELLSLGVTAEAPRANID